ncbi:MAG: ATP synthase F1 subunit epsilon [Bacilli bacterium]
MNKSFKFEVVTPTGVFYKDEVEFISFEAISGEMGVMAHHAPMLVANKPCTLEIEKNKEKKFAFISEGFIEITQDKVSVIVDLAGWADDIDTEEAIKAKRIAEEELESKTQDAGRKVELKASIERASAAIKTAGIRD